MVATGERWRIVRTVLDMAQGVDRFADRDDDEGADLFEDSLRSMRTWLRLLRDFDNKRRASP